jgi:hypothetical protein
MLYSYLLRLFPIRHYQPREAVVATWRTASAVTANPLFSAGTGTATRDIASKRDFLRHLISGWRSQFRFPILTGLGERSARYPQDQSSSDKSRGWCGKGESLWDKHGRKLGFQ